MPENQVQEKWYRQWFDENYLLLYQNRDEQDAIRQINLILKTLSPNKETRILDLACGAGRHTSILHKAGFRIFGLDLSGTLINIAKEKDKSLNLIIADKRKIPGCFDIILSLFTSFGYFENDDENEKVLRSVYDSLGSRGIFWLDFLNPVFIRQKGGFRNQTRLSPDIEVIEERTISNRFVIKNIYFKKGDLQKHYYEIVRLYTHAELTTLFRKTGFRVIDSFGDYSGEKWHSNSQRTIIYGKKV